MSAEVSFTKRAAAELSRCFNGLSTSVARSNSSTSSNSSSSSGHGSGTSGSLSSASEPSSKPTSSWRRKTSTSGQQQGGNCNHVNGDNDGDAQDGNAINGNHETASGNKSDLKKDVPSKLEPSRIEQFKGLFNQDKRDHKDQDNKKSKKEEDKKRRNSSSVASKDNKSSSSSSNFPSFRKSSLNSGDKINVIRLFGNHKPSDVKLTSVTSSIVDTKGFRGGTISTPGTPNLNASRIAGNKPAPPPPRKTSLARCRNFLIGLNKPRTVKELFQSHEFLINFFTNYFNLKERSILAQVCAFWRDVLYNEPNIWKEVTFVLNCSELRRREENRLSLTSSDIKLDLLPAAANSISIPRQGNQSSFTSTVADGCEKKERRKIEMNNESIRGSVNDSLSIESMENDSLLDQSSLLSPTNSATMSDIKSNLYISIEMRGIDRIAFLGANDADIINFTSKTPNSTLKRITHLSLRSTSVTDKGLEALLASVNSSLVQLELSG